MSYPEGEEPPVLAPPVRRDPEASIRRERPPRENDPQTLRRTYEPVRVPARLLAALWWIAATVVAVPLAGFAAHAVFHAIMLGWNLW